MTYFIYQVPKCFLQVNKKYNKIARDLFNVNSLEGFYHILSGFKDRVHSIGGRKTFLEVLQNNGYTHTKQLANEQPDKVIPPYGCVLQKWAKELVPWYKFQIIIGNAMTLNTKKRNEIIGVLREFGIGLGQMRNYVVKNSKICIEAPSSNSPIPLWYVFTDQTDLSRDDINSLQGVADRLKTNIIVLHESYVFYKKIVYNPCY